MRLFIDESLSPAMAVRLNDTGEHDAIHPLHIGLRAPDERVSYGRPVGMTLGPDGSLLVADDVGDVIWRVTAERQG